MDDHSPHDLLCDLPEMKHVSSAAKALSKSLNTRAATWVGTEETENGRCELFDNGEKIATNNAKAIALLAKEDLRVPACYPACDGDGSWLAVEKSSLAMVERADLVAR